MTRGRPDLDPLFAPNSVAVVGASPDSVYSAGLIDAVDHGYDGAIYPVNPGRDEVWGRVCYDAITDVPDVVDLVIVSVPRGYVVDVVREAGRMGVPAALILTAGFSEADREGAELEAELAEVAAEYDVRVCGPNCNGLANLHDDAIFKARGGLRDVAPGSIGLISQSGALAFTTFLERGADEDIGFAHIVSTGNEAVLTTTDYVGYMAADPRVDVICAYIEGISDPRAFVDAAEASVRGGTPVLVVKVGKSKTTEAATISHTGSLVGNDDAWEAAFAQAGVERVPDVPDLLGRAKAHVAYDPPDSNRVCIASTSGGLASLLADMAVDRGLDVPGLADETERTLLDMDELMTFGTIHNPADIRGYGVGVLSEIAEALFADDSFDAYVFALGMPAVGDRAEAVADTLIEITTDAPAPTFLLWTGRKAPLDPAGVQPFERVRAATPLYYDPGRCMDALASLVHVGDWRTRHASRPSRTELVARCHGGSAGADVELPPAQLLPWADAERLLDRYGVPVLETRLATDEAEAERIADAMGGRLVCKVDSTDIPHRSEANAVRTRVSPRDAATAYAEIVRNAREYRPDATIDGVLFQPQVEDGVEALVGMTNDELFGPLVTVAPGGPFVEAIGDPAIRIPPLSTAEGLDAISETRLPTLLDGHAGDGPFDPGPIADVMRAVGRLATDVDGLESLDLNPVFVTDDGVAAADIFIRTR